MIKKINLKRIGKCLFPICIITVTYLAFTPLAIPVAENLWDKGNHIFAFFILASIADFSYDYRLFRVSIILFIYGFFIEAVQYFIPFREFSLLDLIANSFGIGMFVVLRYFFFFFYKSE